MPFNFGSEGLGEGFYVVDQGVEVGGAGGGAGAVGEDGEAVAALGQEAVDGDGVGGRLVEGWAILSIGSTPRR